MRNGRTTVQDREGDRLEYVRVSTTSQDMTDLEDRLVKADTIRIFTKEM